MAALFFYFFFIEDGFVNSGFGNILVMKQYILLILHKVTLYVLSRLAGYFAILIWSS